MPTDSATQCASSQMKDSCQNVNQCTASFNENVFYEK